jgi:hypothetical protein
VTTGVATVLALEPAQLASLIATAVADALAGSRPASPWVSAERVAQHLDTDRNFVYEHWRELGGVKLGDGPRGRLRFKLSDVDACLSGRSPDEPGSPVVEPNRRRRRRQPTGPVASAVPDLLPVRGVNG